ncbi:hypothetical protein VE02_03911 [Pseudogymnoascus sp. 03VT05]|nr:hypothetical protein VE02_03911 [Pseudogymnoascus sp. 03VT05]
MLRPATPLTILLFAAFVLLLISVISVPLVKPIVLGEFDGISYGVFGYCKADGVCSKIEVGYNPSVLPNAKGNFNLDPATRSTLSSILIVHPIAAFFTLIMFILAVVSHFHAPSHSPRYLLGVFILSILTLVLALLSFLIDVLLFVPHMAWGSYIVLAATILIAASGIVSCAMRRTLVSRKARKRRIEENAEMNGENFYNRQAATGPLPAPITAPTIASSSVTGGNGDKLPSFATFESAQADADARAAAQADDDRVPLTSRTPTRSPESIPASLSGRPEDRYGPPPPMPGNRGYGGPPQRDQYGNIIPPPGGMRNPNPRNQFGPGGYRGRGGPQGSFRGRGGGPGYGRGGYGGPGGPGGGPGYGPGPGGMRGGRGPPPNYPGGYNNRGGGGGYGPQRSVSPPSNGYGFDQSQHSLNSSAGGYGGPGDGRPESLARAESPPPMDGMGPVGQAIEMDATTGSRSPGLHPPGGYGGGLRDSDGDVAGMVGLQQQRGVISDGSKYSVDEYIPPRQNWPSGGPRASSPLTTGTTGLHPVPRAHLSQQSEGSYYEDVDPRFSPPSPHTVGLASGGGGGGGGGPGGGGPGPGMIPAPLMPGGGRMGGGSPAGGAGRMGSPARSERSEGRGWQGQGQGGQQQGRMGGGRNVLDSNADFAVPGGRM